MRILILSFSDLQKDARVNRQINSIVKLGFQVSVVALSEPLATVNQFFHVHRKKVFEFKSLFYFLTKQFTKLYFEKNIIKQTLKLPLKNFNFILANDLETLPLALKIKGDAKVIFDAHEYSPREFEESWTWRLIKQSYNTYLCKAFISTVDSMMTVSSTLANEYAKEFNIPKPVVVTNSPSYQDLKPSSNNPEVIRLVHHGFADPSRKIEELIELMALLDKRFTLDLILIPINLNYFNYLKKLASKHASIFFINPLPLSSLISYLNRYDAGLYFFKPQSFNTYNCLPNKFFDFIQARLAVFTGPFPEMQRYIEKYQMGVVHKDFSRQTFAQTLNQLQPSDIALMKENTNKAALELSAEANEDQILSIINNLQRENFR